MSKQRFVILGGGIAGMRAAQTIREQQPNSLITVITAEAELPYIRPLLSKMSFQRLTLPQIYLHDAAWYETQRVELVLGKRVIQLKPEQKQIVLEDGDTLSYDKCIYALGASPFIPPLKGTEKRRVIPLRTLADFKELQRTIVTAKTAVVLGGGAVGLEIADELCRYGLSVTLVESEPHLLNRIVDSETGAWLERKAKAQGILIKTGVVAEEILGTDTCEGVVLSSGEQLVCDCIVLSCGIRANIDLAKASGIFCDRGVCVNDRMQTSAADIYACGDCIQLEQQPNPGLWDYSLVTGNMAGLAASGEDAAVMPLVLPASGFLLNAFGTALYAIGDVHSGSIKAEAITVSEGLFQVNPVQHQNALLKRFVKAGKVVGGILTDNLTGLAALKQEIGSEYE